MSPTISLFELAEYPVFQNRMYDTFDEARNCNRGSIRLVQDLRTGLVHNELFEPNLVVYDKQYQNEQGISSAFSSHLRNVASIVKEHFSGLSLVEVGCGKGHFINCLRERGFHVVGFDPTYEGDDLTIRKEYFCEGHGLKAEGIVLRHVLEHIPSPVSFLRSLAAATGGEGKIYIEVPCLDWILERKNWFDIFYEHVNYFRLSDFERIFRDVVYAERTFDGQYLSVVAELGSIEAPVFTEDAACIFPRDFAASIDFFSNMIARQEKGRSIGIWGAASKGVIFALTMERKGSPVQSIIDINPAKQGKYIPATGLRVLSPAFALEHLPKSSLIFVMNGNYRDEIADACQGKFELITVDQ